MKNGAIFVVITMVLTAALAVLSAETTKPACGRNVG
jgi:hypothetical protein